MKHSKESESRSFLRSVGKSAVEGSGSQHSNNQKTSTGAQKRASNKNFEWEKKVSNFDPKELGEELPPLGVKAPTEDSSNQMAIDA